MLDIDCYEFWLRVVISGNAIATDELYFCDTDGQGSSELSDYLDENFPDYKFSHSVGDNSVYTAGTNVIFVAIFVESEEHR